jgi:hypothetical protein
MKTVTFGVAMAMLPSVHAVAALTVEHEALSCVPVDRYARIGARAGTGTAAAAASLQFRTAADGDWYAVRMTSSSDGEWVAHLPRPARGLGHLEYRIVMTGSDATSSATEPVTVRVADAADCASPAVSSLSMPIAITVPPGAPVVPPVPSGLSPAGVIVAEAAEPAKKGRIIAGAVIGAAVVGATAAAIAGSSGQATPNPPAIPEFTFNGTSPLPGTVLPPVGNPLSVLMVASSRPTVSVPLLWRVELTAAGRICLTMSGSFTIADGPLSVALNALLIAGPNGGCGSSFTTDTLRVTITGQGVLTYDITHTLPFTFQR